MIVLNLNAVIWATIFNTGNIIIITTFVKKLLYGPYKYIELLKVTLISFVS